MAEAQPTLWLIAGPNGVGKTTYAFRHIREVSGSVHFVNLDEIARGLSPLDVQASRIRAARVALDMQDDFLHRGVSFSMETTLSGVTYLGLIRSARERGFRINLQYFIVPTPDVCVARVAKRVRRGGHDVPEPDIRRRYARSIDNVGRYLSAVDRWQVWENSGTRPIVVADGEKGCRRAGPAPARYVRLPLILRGLLDGLPPCT